MGSLSLVIPAFNEAERLPASLEVLRSAFAGSPTSLELVVVDDGSTDETAAIVQEWASKRDAGFKVVLRRIAHRGKGAAVRAGMALVTSEVVGYCDADSSSGPDAIQAVLARIEAGADVAMASRSVPGAVLEVRQPKYREQAGHLWNFMLRKLAQVPYRDTQCGLKLFRAEAAQEIFRLQRLDGFAFDTELIVLAQRLGLKIEEVPIRWRHTEGSKMSMVRDSWRMMRDLLRIVRRLRRADIQAPGVPSLTALERMATSEERHWWYIAKRALVARELGRVGALAPSLDVGCGGGAMLVDIPQPAVGADLSADVLRFAKATGVDRLLQSEASVLPFADGTFGTTIALDVVEHHSNPEEILGEIARVMDDDGVLVVTVPAFQWMWSYADHVLGHYRRYTKAQLSRDLASAGFVVERVTYFHSWLLPIAWIFRKIRTATGAQSADDFPLPGLLNKALLVVSTLEQKLLRTHDLPFGLSVMGVARRARR